MKQVISGCILAILTMAAPAWAKVFPFTILHTNDLHSHLEGTGPDHYFTPQAGDGDPVRGHYARIATLIEQERAAKARTGEPVLLLDAGDFFSGSLFDALGPSPIVSVAPELEFFKLMDYDAFTIGNHEFDAGESGFLNMLKKGEDLGLFPRIVATNLQLLPTAPTDLKEVLGALPRYVVKDLAYQGDMMRVGIIGFQGPDAAQDSSINRTHVQFTGFIDEKAKKKMRDLVTLAEQMAAFLRSEQHVDVVIALIHGGDPEDKQLAGAKGVDFVVAGHTHILYENPEQVGDKWVVQAGCYGRYLGKVELSFDGSKLSLRNLGGTYLTVDQKVASDPLILSKLVEYKSRLRDYLRSMEYRYDDFVTNVKQDLKSDTLVNDPLGVYLTSGVRQTLNRKLADPVDVYFTSPGLIRENLVTVNGQPTRYDFSDIFRIVPLGFGREFRPGSPIVTFYLKKGEFKRLLDVMEVQRMLQNKMGLVYSDSLSYRVRPHGIPFVDLIADLKLNGKPYREWSPYIQMGTTHYVAGFIPKIHLMTHGLITIHPLDKEGHAIAEPVEHDELPGEAVFFADYLRAQ